jgi:hypothetical protein
VKTELISFVMYGIKWKKLRLSEKNILRIEGFRLACKGKELFGNKTKVNYKFYEYYIIGFKGCERI